MKKRTLGKTGFEVTEIALGTWQVGGKWGQPFDHKNADRILNAAVDEGINFIDTADVYGNQESEKAVGRLVKSTSSRIYVATKCGRRLRPHDDSGYTEENIRGFVEESLSNMGLDCLDLIQLHCPPWETYYRPEVFGLFERLKEEGKILHMGVSVEKIEQALKAMEYDNVTTVQIIFNMFRQRPIEKFLDEAALQNVGILARVPLASGLLTGKFGKDTNFESGDHRKDNRQGEQFDKGETFSGVDYHTGLKAVAALEAHFGNRPLAQVALKWILSFPQISCVIPGASKPGQVHANADAQNLNDLTEADMDHVTSIYNKYIKNVVHQLW